MRIVILFMCFAFATAELEEFLKMWQAAMERLATHDRDNNNVQQTTQSPLIATNETATYVSNPTELHYTHPPWASYQENVAFVYSYSQRHQHQQPPSLQHGNHQQNPNSGHHPLPGLHQQNDEQHQPDLGLHQQSLSLHQHHPNPAYDTPHPAMTQTASTVQTQSGIPASSQRDLALARAEHYVSNIERRLKLTLIGGGTVRNTPLPYQDRYSSSSRNPIVTAGSPQLNSQPVTTGGPQLNTKSVTAGGLQLDTQPVPWYEQNSFQTTYPSPSYNSSPHLIFKRTRYTRELPMFAAPGTNPYQTPSIQPLPRPYMREEEREHYGNSNGWGYSDPFPPQIMPLYQWYQAQQLQEQQYQPQQYQAIQNQEQQYQAQQYQAQQLQAQQLQAQQLQAQQLQAQQLQTQQLQAQQLQAQQLQAQQLQAQQLQAQQYQSQQAQQNQAQQNQAQQLQAQQLQAQQYQSRQAQQNQAQQNQAQQLQAQQNQAQQLQAQQLQAQQYQSRQAQQNQAQQNQAQQNQAQQNQAQQNQAQQNQAQQYQSQQAQQLQAKQLQAQQLQAQQLQAQQAQQSQQYKPMQLMNQNYGPIEPAYQPSYAKSNILNKAQTPAMYPSTPTLGSTSTQADQQGMEMNAVIPTFKTAFTRSNIPAPQSTGITAYMEQNQMGKQTTMPSNKGYSMSTPLSWPSQTGWDAQNNNYQTQNNDQTQNNYQSQNNYQTQNNDQMQNNYESQNNYQTQNNYQMQNNYQTQNSYQAQNNYQTQINYPAQNNDQMQNNDPTQNNSQNQWKDPPAYTPQEAAQFNPPPPPKQTPDSLLSQRPASPDEIVKMNVKATSNQTPARTPTIDQMAYYRPEFLHRIMLSG